jgi:hypothetical membrane protein
MQTPDRLTIAALRIGMAAPFLYFGTQLIASLLYPGYSFLSQTASELGSDRSTFPLLFNTGAILTGIAGLIGAVGYLRALRILGMNAVLTWLTAIAAAAGALTSLWAGMYPLPDPRHSAIPPLGLLLFPPLLLAALWKRSDARAMKIYLIATILVIAAMFPIMSGVVSLNTQGYGGLLQRVLALAVFPPVGVGAYYLARVIRQPLAGG